MKYRLNAIKSLEKFGPQRAAANYHTSPSNIYRWRKIYKDSGNNIESLRSKSRKPKTHPNSHTESEIKLIKDLRRRNPNIGLQDLWLKLRKRGYTRTIQGLAKVLNRLQMPTNPKSKRSPTCKKNKPYEQMSYPGQRVQIDVKFVPASCLAGEAAIDGGYYQFTFIDEYSRFRYLEAFKDHSSYSAAQFIRNCAKKFPFIIECVQTDNGSEFTTRMNNSKTARPTYFQKALAELGIHHKLIRVFTPRHNGKVERSHRKDNEYFYASHRFYSFEDYRKQLAVWQRKYNDFPMRPLNWRSPKQVLTTFGAD